MNLQNIDIQTLLPQQPPMLMVGRLIEAGPKSAATEFLVREGDIFVENGALKPYALIENVAQTCAAQLGFADKYLDGNDSVRIGYIGSIKKMRIEAVPKVGEMLITRMMILEEVMDMKLIAAESFVGKRRIATTEMKIALSGERL